MCTLLTMLPSNTPTGYLVLGGRHAFWRLVVSDGLALIGLIAFLPSTRRNSQPLTSAQHTAGDARNTITSRSTRRRDPRDDARAVGTRVGEPSGHLR